MPAISTRSTPQDSLNPTKERILQAALQVIRQKGYTATTVDDLCKTCGISKGSFFHHFKSKEDLVLEATRYWNRVTGDLFAQAPYHLPADPRDRVLAYLDFRASLIQGTPAAFSCFLGTIVQEIHETASTLRDACGYGIELHIATLVDDLNQAKAQYASNASWTSVEVARFIQASLQGAFIIAKANDNPQHALDIVRHTRQYIELLLPTPTTSS